MSASRRPSTLRRSLGLGLMVFYGLGVIIGAGVYVAVGDVIEAAGSLAVLSFAVAGALATLTALSYAELGARYPEAAGAAAYVQDVSSKGNASFVAPAKISIDLTKRH